MQKLTYISKTTHETVNGTSFHGEVLTCPYSTLVSLFGKHHVNDGYKVDAEWLLKTPFGVCTVYNYKTVRNYNGKTAPAMRDITEWHIGRHKEDTSIVPLLFSVVEAYQIGNIKK